MTETNPIEELDPAKINYLSGELFQFLLPLAEAEVVSTVAQALTIRLAYGAKDIQELEQKLKRFPEIFLAYARLNLSNAQSAMLQKAEAVKGMN